MSNSESVAEQQGSSRQDQILRLAAEGMTDKEIAARLNLSPETVGTYWRRILSKYSAASRTEVVAKVVRLQADASISQIEEVNECLREVADHLLLEMSGRQEHSLDPNAAFAAAALSIIRPWVLVVDTEGFPMYTNRLQNGEESSSEPFEWNIHPDDRDAVRNALETVLHTGHRHEILVRTKVGQAEIVPSVVIFHRVEIESVQSVVIEVYPA